MKKNIIRIVKALLRILHIFPINKKKIFLFCFNGNVVGFDQKAIVNWINKNKNNQYEIYWGVASKKLEKRLKLKNVKFIKIKSIKGIFHIMTSKVLIYNINPPTYVPFRKKQILINTWHGGGFLKKVGKYARGFDSDNFNVSNCFISHGQLWSEKILRDSFEYKGDILNCGAPRNDIFFNGEADIVKNQIKKQYNIENKNVLLYAPTFRGDFSYRESQIDFKRVKEELERKFGGEWVILIKLHPMISNKIEINSDDWVNVSSHGDMQELLCTADVLISDYSGCIWDFSLTRKPIFIYADDIDKYNKERGFYFSYDTWPYPIARNNDELSSEIKKFNKNDYEKKLEDYFNYIICFDKGNSCYEIFKYIEKNI